MTDLNPLHSAALKLCKDMDSYQRTNGIVRSCQSNALIFLKWMRKIAKDMGEDPNEITLLACTCYGWIGPGSWRNEKVGEKDDMLKFTQSHMIVKIGESFIDPSHEVNSLSNIEYYSSILSAREDMDYLHITNNFSDYDLVQHAKEFRRFKEFERQGNADPYQVKMDPPHYEYEKEMNYYLDSLNRRRQSHPL